MTDVNSESTATASTASITPATLEPGWHIEPASGKSRYWDGAAWHRRRPSARGTGGSGIAVASLVLGIIGFVFAAIPLFIGWFAGGIPDVVAIVLGVVALAQRGARASAGKAMAVIGLVLGLVSLLAIVFLGAGSIW